MLLHVALVCVDARINGLQLDIATDDQVNLALKVRPLKVPLNADKLCRSIFLSLELVFTESFTARFLRPCFFSVSYPIEPTANGTVHN
jgi:hypothetical protein